jgi:uncharacterized peroxidase-related enzyme
MDAPAPTITIEADPIIPYVEEADYPDNLRPILEPYMSRMGFIPNALKLHMHRPEIAETLWKLNSNIMRDPSSTVDQGLKRKLSAVASTGNGCNYCTSHCCGMLKGQTGADAEGWGMDEATLQALIDGTGGWSDEAEKAAIDFVREATADPANVPAEVHDALKAHFSPPQIVEIAMVASFWKFYNTLHDALNIPIESHVLHDTGYTTLAAKKAYGG